MYRWLMKDRSDAQIVAFRTVTPCVSFLYEFTNLAQLSPSVSVVSQWL